MFGICKMQKSTLDRRMAENTYLLIYTGWRNIARFIENKSPACDNINKAGKFERNSEHNFIVRTYIVTWHKNGYFEHFKLTVVWKKTSKQLLLTNKICRVLPWSGSTNFYFIGQGESRDHQVCTKIMIGESESEKNQVLPSLCSESSAYRK